MNELTVACVWVKANVPYGAEYVTNLRAMVARHLTRPHRFVCLTDRPARIPDVSTQSIAHDPSVFGWWAKLELFNPKRFTGRVLYLDLDTLVVGSLDEVVDYPSRFALLPHGGTFSGVYKGKARRIVPKFNSSVMVWDAGVNSALYTEWAPMMAEEFHGDQDFIGERMPDGAVMPAEWFPRLSEIGHLAAPPEAAKVVLCKKPKNTIAAEIYPWVNRAWRAA